MINLQEIKQPKYKVGDTVYLDNTTSYSVEKIVEVVVHINCLDNGIVNKQTTHISYYLSGIGGYSIPEERLYKSEKTVQKRVALMKKKVKHNMIEELKRQYKYISDKLKEESVDITSL